MPTLTLFPSEARMSLTGVLFVGQTTDLAVVIDASEPATFADGHAYALTIKRRGTVSQANPYFSGPLVVTGPKSATVLVNLNTAALFLAIGDANTLAVQPSVDDVTYGALAFAAKAYALLLHNTSRRSEDVDAETVPHAISAEEVMSITVPLAARVAAMEEAPPGSGDMQAATYDPQGVAGDVFDADNQRPGDTNTPYTLVEQAKLATGVYPAQTAAAATTVGATLAPDFSAKSTLILSATENITTLGVPVGMTATVDGVVWLTLNGFTVAALPVNPCYAPVDGLDLAGPVVKLMYERIGDLYFVSSMSYKQVPA